MSLPNGYRFQVLERDGFRCAYCGVTAREARLEVDHVIPFSVGGSNEPSNLVTACFRCNSGKSARRIERTLSLNHRLVAVETLLSRTEEHLHDLLSMAYSASYCLFQVASPEPAFGPEMVDAIRLDFERAIRRVQEGHYC